MKKVAALFIDAENLYFTQKNGWPIDFERMYAFFAQHYAIYNAFYYTVVDPSNEENYEEKNQYLDQLAFAGYTVRRKQVKLIRAGDKVMRKGNVDIEMVVDMFNTRDLYDVVILFSGDSDFERALELLRTYGKEVLVVSAKGSVARELINAADKYIDLEKLKVDVAALPAAADKKTFVMPKLRPMVQTIGVQAAQAAPVAPQGQQVPKAAEQQQRRPQQRRRPVAPRPSPQSEQTAAQSAQQNAQDPKLQNAAERRPQQRRRPLISRILNKGHDSATKDKAEKYRVPGDKN